MLLEMLQLVALVLCPPLPLHSQKWRGTCPPRYMAPAPMVSRMDPGKASDYKAVKEMLLREFKLSPAVYLDKFNTDKRKQDETCLMYSARLVAIWTRT